MRISARTEYSLVVMLELAQAGVNTPVSSRELALRTRIPKPFLDQVLVTLRKAGLIRSARGPAGGYVVARDPRELSVHDVIESIEGGTGSLSCVPGGAEAPTRRVPARRSLASLWARVDSGVSDMLRGVRLSQLCEEERRLASQPMYYI